MLQEEVDLRALPLLSEDDLAYLGVTSASQRRVLLAATKDMKQHCAPSVCQTGTPQMVARLPAAQGQQNQMQRMNGVSEPAPPAQQGKRQHQSSRKNRAQQRRIPKHPVSQGETPAPKSALSKETVAPAEALVPDSEEESDFADVRPSIRPPPPVRKRPRCSPELPSKPPTTSEPAPPQPSTPANPVPASIEEDREQLERALKLSLSGLGDPGADASQLSSHFTDAAVAAAQHVSARQLPGRLSGALGRVLAARSSRGRFSQNRSYSRLTEQRLLDALYPPSRDSATGTSGRSDGGQYLGSMGEDRCGGCGSTSDGAGWSSDEEGAQQMASSAGQGGGLQDNGCCGGGCQSIPLAKCIGPDHCVGRSHVCS